ncbi:MAG: aromatic hydrocarbon degradation protein, partial [Sphingobacteriales bacterium]
MKRIAYVIGFVFCAQQLSAQIPEDAIRMSWNTPSGTARNQAIGGAMGSLGGEITTLFVNPAGLGMYKKGEFVLSPGISFNKGTGVFRGTEAKSESVSKFNLGTSGFVWSWQDGYSKWKNKTFAIGVNRVANFNNIQY